MKCFAGVCSKRAESWYRSLESGGQRQGKLPGWNLEEIQKLAEDEVMDYTLKKELEILKDRVSNPEYGEPQEVVVFISENENSRYAITPESMTLIGNTLFY